MISHRPRPLAAIILAVVAGCSIFSGTALAHEGWGIVVDRQGQIYFSDIPTNTIWRITRGGNLEAVIRKHSHALVLGEDGSVYGTQEHHASAVGGVWRIAPGGGVSDVFTPARDFPLNLHPFIIDREGNVYSTNSISFPNQSDKMALLKAAPDGGVAVLAGGARGHQDGPGSDARFSGLDGMAWAADGSLYVTDGVYVRRVTADGAVTTLGKGALTSQSWGEDLMGLAVDEGGGVYVADYSGRRVIQMLPDGNARTVVETGLIWSPTGVTVAGEDLYVLEHLRMPLVILGDVGVGAYARVRKVSRDGKAVTIATVWGRNTLTFAVVSAAVVAASVLALRLRRRRKTRRPPRTAAA